MKILNNFKSNNLKGDVSGGNSKVSSVINSIVVLLIFFVLTPLIGMVPKIVIATILLVVSVTMIDSWSIQLVSRLFKKRTPHKSKIIIELLIIISVMFITVFFNLIIAVLLGIFIAFFMFISKMSKSIVRRDYRGNAIHSNKQRPEKYMEFLNNKESKIVVLELEGSIFFGSANNLYLKIENLLEAESAYFILDMKRINDIDSSVAKLLEQIFNKISNQDKYLAISYLDINGDLWNHIKNIGVFSNLNENILFPDTDQALEFFEDKLINDEMTGVEDLHATELKDFSVLRKLKKEDIDILKTYLTLERYKKGEPVFSQGDKGDSVFLY